MVEQPIIDVTVLRSVVAESGSDNLVYTFTRTGDVSSSLSVNFTVGGTASRADFASSIDLNTYPVIAWSEQLGSDNDKQNDPYVSSEDFAWALATGSDGSIYISGYTYGNLGGQVNYGDSDAFLIKYGSDGVREWTKLLGNNSYDEARSLTIGADGSVYVSGGKFGTIDGNPFWLRDAFVTKYLSDGREEWTRVLDSGSHDFATTLTAGLDGSIYVGGYTYGNLDGIANKGDLDAFITKFLPDGTKVWTQLLGTESSDSAQALTTGLDGTIYVGGFTTGQLDGGNSDGGHDAFITKYNTDGAKVWTELLGTIGPTVGRALTTGLDGAIYFGGFTNGNLDGQIYLCWRIYEYAQYSRVAYVCRWLYHQI
jgi:hypothetical protein